MEIAGGGLDGGSETTEKGPHNNYFRLKLHHGGVLVGKEQKQYVGGVVDIVEACEAQSFSLGSVKELASKNGCVDLMSLQYVVPLESTSLSKFRPLENEDDASDIVAIGIIYDEVDVFVIHESHIRHLGSQVESSITGNVDGEFGIDIPIDEVGEGMQMENDDTDDSDCEYFHDSDYAFEEDNDDAIYEKYVDVAVTDAGELVDSGHSMNNPSKVPDVNATSVEPEMGGENPQSEMGGENPQSGVMAEPEVTNECFQENAAIPESGAMADPTALPELEAEVNDANAEPITLTQESSIEANPSEVGGVSNAPKTALRKCNMCGQPGHNKQTCQSKRGRFWRMLKAANPFLPS